MTRGVTKGKVTVKELKEKLGFPEKSQHRLLPLLKEALEKNLISQQQFEASLPTTTSTIKCYLYSMITDVDTRQKIEEYVQIASKLYIRGSYIANLHALNCFGQSSLDEQNSFPRIDDHALNQAIQYDIHGYIEDEINFKQIFLPERWPSSKQPRCPLVQDILHHHGQSLQHLYTDNWEEFMKTSGWDNALNTMYTKYRANVENHVKVHIFGYIKDYLDRVILQDEGQRFLIKNLFNQPLRPYIVHNDDFEWIVGFRQMIGQHKIDKSMFRIGEYNSFTAKLWIWMVKFGVARTTYLPLMSLNRKYCYIDIKVAQYLLPKRYKTIKRDLGRDPTIGDIFNVNDEAFRQRRKQLRKRLRQQHKSGNNKKLKKKWYNNGHSNIPKNATVKVIETDGVGVSIIIHRPIDPFGTSTSPISDKNNLEMLDNPVFSGVDEGRAKIFVASVSTDPLKKPETVSFTRKQYYKEIKSKVRSRWENNKVASNPPLQQILVNLSEDNGTLNMSLYIQKVSIHHEVLQQEYIADKERALWKMRLYRFKKRSLDLAVRRILEKAKKRHVVIGIGSASFPSTSKGEQAVPTTSMMKAFIKAHYRHHKRVILLNIDEFRTTMCCCACGNVTEAKVKADGRRSTRLRSCTMCDETTVKVRDRDVQASRNMLWLTQHVYYGAERPFYMCRNYRHNVPNND